MKFLQCVIHEGMLYAEFEREPGYPDCLRWPLADVQKELGRPEPSLEEYYTWAIARYREFARTERIKQAAQEAERAAIKKWEEVLDGMETEE